MTDAAGNVVAASLWLRRELMLGKSTREYLRTLISPFNAIAAIVLSVGIPVTINRFWNGLAASTNLSDDAPWGLWVGFDVLCGVALAAGGFVMASAVHLFGLRDYKPLVRPAILTGFLGYAFVVFGLLYDLGRPWRLPYPLFLSPGVTSVKFEVAWCVALYLTVQFIEFSPALFEWLGWRYIRQLAAGLTVGASAFGVILSTMHQSALGGLLLMAPAKVHPLWYSPYVPLLFFASAAAGGISMVIFQSMLSYRVFTDQVTPADTARMEKLLLGLGRAGAIVLFTYFSLKCFALAHGQHWNLILTGYGAWWLVEMLGFVLAPCLLYAIGYRQSRVRLVKIACVITILGVILNRLNISIITYRWYAENRYVPNWQEYAVSLTVVTLAVLTFRWIVNRMPILRDDPRYAPVH